MGIIEIDLKKADVYDKEVITLLADGGFGKLMSQYKVISRRLDECSKLNKELKQRIAELEQSRSEWIDKAVEWQQKCEKLESNETETCEKEPISDDCRPSIEWYENRHQSDCIEINRLNTTIDVLIHKIEYLRQFAGLE